MDMAMVIIVMAVFKGMVVFPRYEIVFLHLLLDCSLRMGVLIDQRERTAGECINRQMLELRLGRWVNWDICNLL